MNPRSHNRAGFSLLELLVVLTILAIVTTLAVRSVDQVEAQRRYETTQRGLQELQDAILGSPDDRAADGSRTISGFVADMGRLPLARGAGLLDLRELWVNAGAPFDVRPALASAGVPEAHEDAQVLVPGGWRGPYLRLPLGVQTLLDGWGNPIASPADASPPDPDGAGYARLRDGGDNPITAPGQEVRLIRILGANGRRDTADTGYDRDEAVTFEDDRFRAGLSGHAEVVDGTSPVPADPGKSITVRLYGPSAANPAQISVLTVTVPFTSNPVTYAIPALAGGTIGPRAVRACLHGADSSVGAALKRSAVKTVTLRPGANLLDLVIDR